MRILLSIFLCLVASTVSAQTAMITKDLSGTIATGGTFQTITVPSGVRHSVDFQNVCSVSGNCNTTSDVCYLYFGNGAATIADSITLQAGQGYLRSSGSIPGDVIQLTCTTTSDSFRLWVQ